MLKFYLRTKYCTVMYIPDISAGLFVIMGFNPDYQNPAVPFPVSALSNPTLLNSFLTVRCNYTWIPKPVLCKGWSQAYRPVSFKHVTGSQPDFEVGKPLEYSKAKEAFDCKIKSRLNAGCCVVVNVVSLPGLLSNKMSCRLKVGC